MAGHQHCSTDVERDEKTTYYDTQNIFGAKTLGWFKTITYRALGE